MILRSTQLNIACQRLCKGFVLVVLLVQLASCGYQLRDASTAANQGSAVTELGPLYIESDDNTPFYSLLRSKLNSASITLTTDQSKSRYRLKVYGFKNQQQPLSYAKNGDVYEYRHQASLAFQLTDANNFSAINATRLKAEEIVRSDQNRLAVSQAKATQLQRELAQKLVDQIFWALKTASIRVQSAQPKKFVTPAK